MGRGALYTHFEGFGGYKKCLLAVTSIIWTARAG